MARPARGTRRKRKIGRPRGTASAAAAATPKRRKRQRGVRARILKILAHGPITNAALRKEGGFTASALYLHIKALREAGLLSSHRDGRYVTLSLRNGGHGEPLEGEVVADTPRPANSKSSALMPAFVSKELREALNAVAHRLSPVEGAQEKLLVLDQLARTMPAAVSEVLRGVMHDLVKLSNFGPSAK